jgi:hypothetical protein
MAYHKFGPNDIFNNVIKAHPKCEFFIHRRTIYYNGEKPQLGTINPEKNVKQIPSGYLSLYELNIDRLEDDYIYPFITKDGNATPFKSVSKKQFQQFGYGDIITGSYPASTSISVERYDSTITDRPRLRALRNTIEYYKPVSCSYTFDNKLTEDLTLISIPSIFYGSSIDKGTVSMQFYYDGELLAELKDKNQNGELIQTYPEGVDEEGEIAGIVLYNEGFIILEADWGLDYGGIGAQDNYIYEFNEATGDYDVTADEPRWIYWGSLGYEDTVDSGSGLTGEIEELPRSSFGLSFNGTNYVPTITMLAHAKKGELNHSNNPTYLTEQQTGVSLDCENPINYIENKKLNIANITFSPYEDPDSVFEKTTWISKIGLYDENKNLIAIATLANPVKKTEKREFTFKLKLDI